MATACVPAGSACHNAMTILDPVPRMQITFREGFVRDLKVDIASGIEQAPGSKAPACSCAMSNPVHGCAVGATRALRNAGKALLTT